MVSLGELLKKHKANFVSTVINGVMVTHVKGLTLHGDVELKEGNKYYVNGKDSKQ